MLNKYFILLLILLFSCKPVLNDNLRVTIITSDSDLDLRLYYQDNFFDNYNEGKSVSASKIDNKYVFRLTNIPLNRIRIDFDNLEKDKLIIREIEIKKDNLQLSLKGKPLVDFFKFNSGIQVEINDDDTVLLIIKDKKDPYFVSKNLSLL